MDDVYLECGDFADEPLSQFALWYSKAQQCGMALPHAMTLATADAQGNPSARMVLLKDCDERGFTFYTNYDSDKADHLQQNPRAALVFHWEPLRYQVRVEGRVEKVSAAEADAYFATRPLSSQLGAWASPQSQIIENRSSIQNEIQKLEDKYAETDVPRPPHWGGYRVVPQCVEFWVSRQSRLHDRFVYRRTNDTWELLQLAP